MPFPKDTTKHVKLTATVRGDYIVASLSLSNPRKQGDEAMNTDGKTHGTVARKHLKVRLGAHIAEAVTDALHIMLEKVPEVLRKANL